MTNGINDPNISTVTGPGYAPPGGGPIVPPGDLGGQTIEDILRGLQGGEDAVHKNVEYRPIPGFPGKMGLYDIDTGEYISQASLPTGGAGALPPGVRVEPMEGQPGFVRIVAENGQTVGYQADPSFVSPAQQHTMRMNEVQATLQFWQGQVDAGRLTSDEAGTWSWRSSRGPG